MMQMTQISAIDVDVSMADDVLFIETNSRALPWSRAMVEDAFEGMGRVLGIKAEGRLVGYLSYRVTFDEAEVMNIAVLPEFRRRGLAASMMNAYHDKARASGAASSFLEVRASNVSALGLYEKLGYVRAGTRKNYYPLPEGGREDAIVMQRNLTDA